MSTSELHFCTFRYKTVHVIQKHYREGDACRDDLAEHALQLRDLWCTAQPWGGARWAAQLSVGLSTLGLTVMQIIDSPCTVVSSSGLRHSTPWYKHNLPFSQVLLVKANINNIWNNKIHSAMTSWVGIINSLNTFVLHKAPKTKGL